MLAVESSFKPPPPPPPRGERERRRVFLSFFLSFGHTCRSLSLPSSSKSFFCCLDQKLLLLFPRQKVEKRTDKREHFFPEKVPFFPHIYLYTRLEQPTRDDRRRTSRPTVRNGRVLHFFIRFVEDLSRSTIATRALKNDSHK